ncbi:hypothetical protein IV38_GL000485 [Lactobacillus selangorensis]|uniref:Riboflavin biosynthesis protein n=1 Tax=Lactobacillus selangorensis TaxID=81857 RepID=A0A0R2FZD9_9LACO|nr:riboflavin biosynthesis protein RibF [Lactobacillus selangorensis]KRN29599.1 hypothetical protein IV38_GL000485 [Lactobacillus selangorensis]KRN33871.1 hypothetical protein IV40_GL000183 [Lactobacillus selangorensis]
MQTITLIHPYPHSRIPNEPVVLALGFFDGVHKGHQAVINRAKQIAIAKHEKLAVLTFDVHPAVGFRNVPADEVQYLSTLTRKQALMAALGVDLLYVAQLNAGFKYQAPQAFVDNYIVGLHANVVVAGFDYTYGRPVEKADMAALPVYAHARFEIVTVGEDDDAQGEKVSSTHIRQLLDHGDVAGANALLGYIYCTTGTVVHGEQRGRELGFPTINIDTPHAERLPSIGIYATKVQVKDQWYMGMASIGRNVTFGPNRPVTVEINLLDFKADVYGQPVQVAWYQYLRGEVKFDGADGLIAQLKRDAQHTRDYFQKLGGSQKDGRSIYPHSVL